MSETTIIYVDETGAPAVAMLAKNAALTSANRAEAAVGFIPPIFVAQPSFSEGDIEVGQSVTINLGAAPGADMTIEYLTLNDVDDTENLTL